MIQKSAELSERLAAKVTNRAVRRIRSRYVRVVKMDDPTGQDRPTEKGGNDEASK